MKVHGNTGKVHSEESKLKSRQIMLGRKVSEETRKKRSETLKRMYKNGEMISYWKGRKRSKETIEKIRKGNIGKNFGRKHTKEEIEKRNNTIKEKIAKGLLPNIYKGLEMGWKTARGRIMSEEARRKISESKKGKPSWSAGKKRPEITGPKNCNWKGGCDEKTKIRVSLEYRLFRLSVFERDNFTCQMPGCGKIGGSLNCHHIEKFSENEKLRLCVENGITLCEPCHRSIWKKEDKYVSLFKQIINLTKNEHRV